MRRIEQRWTRPLPELGREAAIDAHLIHFATVFGDWDLLPVIHEDGGVQVAMVQRTIYPDGVGLWGCAHCEQWHPANVKSCPLFMRDRMRIAIGPFYHDEGEVSYVVATIAQESFDGTPRHGVGMYRLTEPVTFASGERCGAALEAEA